METDITDQECHFSVGYFTRKVGLNPYLFSVVHDQVEINPKLLMHNEADKKRREAKDTVAAAESRRLRNMVQKKWRARRTSNEAAKVENQRLRNNADIKRRADSGTAAAETRRLRSKAEKKWRTRRTDDQAATAESRRQRNGQHSVEHKNGLNIYELVRRNDQVEVQWFGATEYVQDGTKYPCVRLHHLPVVRVRADKPTASEALAALLQEIKDKDLRWMPLFRDITFLAGTPKNARRCLDEGRHYVRTDNTWVIRCVLMHYFDDRVVLRLKIDDFEVCEDADLVDHIWTIVSLKIPYVARGR